ncbi:putative ankyrin repeat-containing domain-containing protein [Helianthus annuus]|uniref:Ankyrin repeat-containing domain-containing protein n=2 Tax=Helianthus annuus TaxID=4232 RepID=A0A9K3HH83_HELAN|nr:putative ankyrin repeat-containing domain-containing protein [Helianthus annuus]KAJ0678547.1 putative ankyrin repeat-containing domain-containing protein [Helianthus annuus]
MKTLIKMLLFNQAGARTDTKVSLGAWSWDLTTGEEFRVGAGLAEPYSITWCAVEYFEETGSILNVLLQHVSPNIPHFGRTLIHHAILCANLKAIEILLNRGADPEFPIQGTGSRLIHLAARRGYYTVLNHLVNAGCNLDSKTEGGETALMICARYKHVDCLKLLARSGADFGLVNMANQCVQSIAGLVRWTLGLRQAILDVVRTGTVLYSSDTSIFSTLMFVTRINDVASLEKIVDQTGVIDLNEQDENGYSAVMVAVINGHVDAFRLLVFAGADVNLGNKYGDTAISLSKASVNCGDFEKVILEYALTKSTPNSCNITFYTLHRAASKGDYDTVEALTNGENNVNAPDSDGYTPLMLAARGGHGKICKLLISKGAICDIENARHETALMLARENGVGNDAERVLLDHMARGLVLGGDRVKKHCKGGKGCPHTKQLVMVEDNGLLRWGKSSRRNVVCKWAEVGPSVSFRWNRRKKADRDEPGLFRVVTTRNKEVHFVCEGGVEMAELWVRGIELVTREAIFGK